MKNLEPYNLVSNQSSISRYMLIVIGIDTDLQDICEQFLLNIFRDARSTPPTKLLSI
ncbi:hypothetical protein [Nostoc sp. CENA543]|uniref:hypothetical protein n=1 Tax=Nostoc sp. CENA543 TaxID=1869241 RepID=UPI001CEF63E0|nr:hypothetical protein [Nostoc sp. CENA543]